MPYHVFEINAFRQYRHVDSLQDYRAAKQLVRELRTAPTIETGTTYRMMFAANATQAEQLLKEKREPRPAGEHD
jgi:phage-related protein